MTYRRIALLLVSALAVLAAGCHELDAGIDIARQPNGAGDYSASIRDREPPGDTSNTYRGREVIWADINAVCNERPENQGPGGAPGAGYEGYYAFSPPTENCITAMIAEVQDDPNVSDDTASWVCVEGHDCQPGGTGTADQPFTDWYRSKFTSSTQGRDNMKNLILAARDFNAVAPTDSSTVGSAGCIAIIPTATPQVQLKRVCF